MVLKIHPGTWVGIGPGCKMQSKESFFWRRVQAAGVSLPRRLDPTGIQSDFISAALSAWGSDEG